MNKQGVISKIIQVYKQSGLAGVFYQISENEYFPENIFHFSKSNLYIYDGRDDLRYDYTNKLDIYSFEIASKNDIQALLGLSAFDENDFEFNRKRLVKFFDDGNSCYLIKDNEIIAAFVFLYRKSYTLTRNNYRFINLNMVLSENILFFGYGFISKKYRMRGLFPYIIDFAVKQDPGSIFITEVSELNAHSHKSHISLGFRKIYSVIALCVLSKLMLVWKLCGEKSALTTGNSELTLFWDESSMNVGIKKNTKTITRPFKH